jgi:aspartyl-tRNA synthetase
MLRTHTCGELRKSHVGKKVELCGWVDTIRNHGKLWFIDLRDRHGKVQVVFREEKETSSGLRELSVESCVRVSGGIIERKKGTENKEIETGEIEVSGKELEIFTKCPPMPFELNDEKVAEDVRLKWRFLDLRSEKMKRNMILRGRVNKAIHDYLGNEGFVEIETPILNKSTPEGARDYVVPSRVHAGKFYALPQSPQIMKQLMMVAGYDKYYQIARCFRDEDLRADRQPEFTQLDMEMSFVDVNDVIGVMEKLWTHVFKEVLGVIVKTPFPRITYDNAMKKYGRDSPDVRTKEEKEKGKLSFVWVVDFPMFEYDSDDKRWKAVHHPFTSPDESADFTKPKKMKAKAYDLVLNGSEIGGGSIRIHNKKVQDKVFSTLGLSKKEAEEKFGFLLDALTYGAPPHGGIAFGLDRVCQLMTGSESIRDVVAFPKNKAAQDMMMDSPSDVDKKQLKEVHLKLDIGKGNKKGKRK